MYFFLMRSHRHSSSTHDKWRGGRQRHRALTLLPCLTLEVQANQTPLCHGLVLSFVYNVSAQVFLVDAILRRGTTGYRRNIACSFYMFGLSLIHI